jgi:hypothetical protein
MTTERSASTGKQSDISKLIRDGVDGPTALAMLKDKYTDKELIANVYAEYENRMSDIKQKAQKFAKKVLTKYSHLGTKVILQKAKKWSKKLGYNDEEYSAFVNVALSDKTLANTAFNVPNTPLGRTLGYTPDFGAGKMSYKPNELGTLQEILAIHQATQPLHSQLVVQSLLYKDCGPEALSGKYDHKNVRMSVFSHVDPVLAALFLPRIKYLDEHALIGSISNIIASRYAGTPIKTQPDYELYYDMISDPNEICTGDAETSINELLRRVKFQIEIWKQVNELRQGRYYNVDPLSFTTAINECRLGIFDAPDMAYVKDEISTLRKIFGVLSLRPTYVSVSNIMGAGYMTNNLSINPMAMTQITTIPIINFRLPYNFNRRITTVQLQDAIRQPEFIIENKALVLKQKEIIHSRDVIVFAANRRFQTINYAKLTSPYIFNALPTTLSGFETLNDIQIQYPDTGMRIGQDLFEIRSVVVLERAKVTHADPKMTYGQDLITGTTACVVVKPTGFNGLFMNKYIVYNPQDAANQHLDRYGNLGTNDPIVGINKTNFGGAQSQPESFVERTTTRGTIFVFTKM